MPRIIKVFFNSDSGLLNSDSWLVRSQFSEKVVINYEFSRDGSTKAQFALVFGQAG